MKNMIWWEKIMRNICSKKKPIKNIKMSYSCKFTLKGWFKKIKNHKLKNYKQEIKINIKMDKKYKRWWHKNWRIWNS